MYYNFRFYTVVAACSHQILLKEEIAETHNVVNDVRSVMNQRVYVCHRFLVKNEYGLLTENVCQLFVIKLKQSFCIFSFTRCKFIYIRVKKT